MSDVTKILKIRFVATNIDSDDLTKRYLSHEVIFFGRRVDALRFLYELYEVLIDVHPDVDVSGLRVKSDEKICCGVETKNCIYELIGV